MEGFYKINDAEDAIQKELAELNIYDLIIDARSQREYAVDHIPERGNMAGRENEEYAVVSSSPVGLGDRLPHQRAVFAGGHELAAFATTLRRGNGSS
jgi:rhodanese-related sulfurtransferase